MFQLDPQLEKDTIVFASLPLCELLLMNDVNYPWMILVPRCEHARELVELGTEDQLQFLMESNAVSQVLQTQFAAEKLNIAALGNIVAQLHIHHIARFKNDKAWPKPIWGVIDSVPYSESQRRETLNKIRQGLADHAGFTVNWRVQV